MFFAGMKLMTSVAMVEEGEPQEVARSWKERLFSRPWRPLRKTKTVTPMVPMKQALVKGDQIWMHPAMLELLKRELINKTHEASFMGKCLQPGDMHDKYYFKGVPPRPTFGMPANFGEGS